MKLFLEPFFWPYEPHIRLLIASHETSLFNCYGVEMPLQDTRAGSALSFTSFRWHRPGLYAFPLAPFSPVYRHATTHGAAISSASGAF